MDIISKSKNELIDSIKKKLVSPNVIKKTFSNNEESKYSKFLSDVKQNRQASVDLPIDFVTRFELFSLIKSGKVFVSNTSKFIANITTVRPKNSNKFILNKRFVGNEFDYSFVDNHPGILCVDYLKDIPVDYEGFMAVPVTVLESGKMDSFNIHKILYTPIHNNKHIYPRIVITNKQSV